MTNQYSYAESFSDLGKDLPKQKIAEPNISSAARVYMISRMKKENGSSVYRNGNDNGRKYMTQADFVTYFKDRENTGVRPENVAKRTTSGAEIYRSRVVAAETANEPTVRYAGAPKKAAPALTAENTRGISRPASQVRPMSDARQVKGEEPNVKIYSPAKKDPAPNVDPDMKIYPVKQTKRADSTQGFAAPKKKSQNNTSVFNKVNSEKLESIKRVANDWIPEEKIIKARKQKKSRSFSRMVLAVAGVAASLMLIVSGSVLMSGANSEVKDLEKELQQLEAREKELQMELEMKNDVNMLLERADDLGMIRKEYVEASYLQMGGSDRIETNEPEEEEDNIGISAILSAFGIGN